MTTPSTAMNLGNIRTFVGKEVGVSEWECIDQHRIEAFAGNTGDDQWIHVDPERAARESPYGATIAHGYLLLSLLAPTTLNIVFKPAQIRTTINYGVDRVRFISPVKAGARVRNRIKLVAAEDKGEGRTLITTASELEIEGQSKPALIAQALWMALP